MRSFKTFALLLEYDEEKNWATHGPKILERMKSDTSVPLAAHDNGPYDEGNHGPLHPERAYHHFSSALMTHDPTDHQEYSQWISKSYASGGINRFEDIGSRAGPALKTFHKAKVTKQLQKNGVSADINSYKKLGDLETAVEPFKEIKSIRELKDTETTKHDEEHWQIVVPHTMEAAQKYGAHTKWCTAAEHHEPDPDNELDADFGAGGNMFDHYNREGKLHMFIPKKPRYEGEKYQYHNDVEGYTQFMNDQDEPATAAKVFKDRPSPYHTALVDAHANPESHHDHPDHSVRVKSAMSNILYQNDDLAAKFAKDPHPAVREQVARRANHSVLLNMLDDPEPAVKCTIAHRGVGLDKLATDKVQGVRIAAASSIAYNSTPENRPGPYREAIASLANDDSYHVRQQVAKDFPEAHDKLKNDPHELVRMAVAFSPHASQETIDHLRNDPHERVKKQAELAHMNRNIPHNKPLW